MSAKEDFVIAMSTATPEMTGEKKGSVAAAAMSANTSTEVHKRRKKTKRKNARESKDTNVSDEEKEALIFSKDDDGCCGEESFNAVTLLPERSYDQSHDHNHKSPSRPSCNSYTDSGAGVLTMRTAGEAVGQDESTSPRDQQSRLQHQKWSELSQPH